MLPFRKPFASLRTALRRLPVFGGLFAGLLLLGGCGSTQDVADVNTQQVQPLEEVAVVSVRTKKGYQNEIDEKSLDDTKNVREAVSTITEVTERQGRRADPNFRAASEQVRDYLFGTFRSEAPFSLLDEGTVLKSSAYQRCEENKKDHWRTSLFSTPEGYRSLERTHLKSKMSAKKLIEGLPSNPDGVLFAETRYTLVRADANQEKKKKWTSSIRNGTHAGETLKEGETVRAKVKATVRVHVLDRNGNTALQVVQTAQSDEGFTFVYGQGWEKAQIDEAAQRSTRKAIENITTHLRNNIPSDVLAETTARTSQRGK